jgi:hypothetical protein
MAALCTLSTLVITGLYAPATSLAREPFGIESFEVALAADEAGAPDTQAGSHPFSLTTNVELDHYTREEREIFPNQDPKSILVTLPAGVVVNPLATTERCTEAELEREGLCPNASAVGVATLNLNLLPDTPVPIFNMIPQKGVPAELGFNVAGQGIAVHLIGGVRTGGDYAVQAEASEILQKQVALYGAKVVLWGDPSAEGHDPERGICARRDPEQKEVIEREIEEELKEKGFTERENLADCPVAKSDRPLLTMPTSCDTGALTASVSTDSWQEPEHFLTATASAGEITGCERLPFGPKLSIAPDPDPAVAAAPSGLSVTLEMPQTESLKSLAESDLKEASVSLPPGFVVSPSAANGLAACSEAQIALTAKSPAACPDASKLGTVQVETPLLSAPLEGALYIAQQGNLPGNGSNPFGTLFAVYLVAEGSGVVLKLPGAVTLDGSTGQISVRFGEDPARSAATGQQQFLPQLPFNKLLMHLFSGPRAALTAPASCGEVVPTALLTSWSGSALTPPLEALPVAGGCATGGFAPSFAAGTTSNQAGSFSPLDVKVGREDGQQYLQRLQLALPPGLLADVSGVPRCDDQHAVDGDCPAASRIGSVTVGAGPGPDPFYTNGGVYLTNGYKGAPFGEVAEVPAVAGPFNLGEGGRPIAVRGAIQIDPNTAQVTVFSDPFPTILQGVPLQVRSLDIDIDRPHFALNPTGCRPSAVSGTLGSAQGATMPVTSSFVAVNCATLKFAPRFSASTAGATSKANGASLVVKISEKPGEANIRKVDLQLPIVLPSRLTTLQKACTEQQFGANPAACPADSVVGSAVARTPILGAPLTGPAYLVSHGGEAFPDVEFVLQGEGVTIVLDGKTDIKKGITYSRFETVPDAPISSFETTLPEGPHSVLTTHARLCALSKTLTVSKLVKRRVHGRIVRVRTKVKKSVPQQLLMPTTIVGQNGAQLTQSTRIAVTGCSKAPAKNAKAKRKAKKAKHG